MTTRFVEALQEVPPLLSACLRDDETPSLRKLRLVSKDASRVALLGLSSYTLTLNGAAGDTNVSGGARLLKPTRLKHLSVHLCLKGELLRLTRNMKLE